MPNTYTNATFSTTYNDDWTESDGYHRILFNSGRLVQARELTQSQTIIHEEISRFGRNIFKEGAAVNPGGMTVNNRYEFIKLGTALALPSDTSTLVGTIYTGASSGVKVKVVEVVAATGADPDTLYVQYTDTASGTSGSTAIRMSAGESITNGAWPLVVQTTNTTGNPAIGVGTRVSMSSGDFFTQGRFVFAVAQSSIVSKYTSTPSLDIGFKVVQDIVTSSDTTALFDNAGDLPNLSAPGADRYRISLTISTRDDIDSDENFVYVGKLIDGVLVDIVKATDDYNVINDLLALRTKEESGNYNVKDFLAKFDENDSDTTALILDVSDGISYVNGYRASIAYPTKIDVSKAQDTTTLNNEVVAANYGNYIITSGGLGLHDINEFELVNLRDSASYLGSTIGTARVRAMELEAGSGDLRQYIFDVKMNSGSSFRNVKSFGSGVTDYSNILLENAKAVLKNTGENSLLFPLPNDRPQSMSDISLTVQRRFSTTTDGAGAGSINLTAPGETFSNTSDWMMANADSDLHTTASVAGAGTAAATISSGPISSSNLEVVGYVNKSAGASRTKTLTETTVTTTIDSDGNGVQYIDLALADIYNVSRIRDTDSDGTDITSKFTVDTGQRDNLYGLGRLVLKGGQTAPAGNVFARFEYFTHGTSGDFFSVSSYTGQVDYDKIPTYTQNNGNEVPLRDTLDFRPVQNSSTTYSGGAARVNELPEPTDLITSDVVYYMPRYARLVVNTDGTLEVLNGPSSLTPIFPEVHDTALNLYDIKLNAYTLNDSDVTLSKIDTRRYTMADIDDLNTKVENLKEVTALSLLELETSSFEVLDSAGLNRTKSGFMVDNFKNTSMGDTANPEYKSSIDFRYNHLRPSFSNDEVKMSYDSDLSSNTIKKADRIYLKYDEVTYIDQPLVSRTENVNPFAVFLHFGEMTLSPNRDEWREITTITVRAGQRNRNTRSRAMNTTWLATGVTSWGRGEVDGFNQNGRNRFRGEARRRITRDGNIIADDNSTVIPFMRSIKIFFRAEGMRPNTRVFPFFDGVNVSDWCREESFQRITDAMPSTERFGNRLRRVATTPSNPEGSSTLTTDAEGTIEGSFIVPNNENIQFRTGVREFKLLDISADVEADALTVAKAPFEANGLSIVNVIVREREEREEPRVPPDPLAQSFFVIEDEGIFLTKLDLYFATKATTDPVWVEIREMVNGYPSSNVLENSTKLLAPASVNTSADGTTATSFEFDAPVFLSPNTEYSFVVLANTTEYNIYIAKIYDFILGSTEKRVNKQPASGSMFKSQNSSTWTADQTSDIAFKLYRADFDTAGGYLISENVDLPRTMLEADPISTDSGDATITFAHPNHGFTVSDDVTIYGIDSGGTVGGIAGTSILGTRAITALDNTGYTVEADSAATSTTFGGGSEVIVTKNVMFDTYVPYVDKILPKSTALSHEIKLTTGKSYAGTETAYQKDTSYSSVYINQDNNTLAPRLVASPTLETAELGAGVRSSTLKSSMTTTSSKVSPVVDGSTLNMITWSNDIDNQAAAPATGYNVPLNYVAETDPSDGSHASKHITKAVTLEEDAVGIKVIMGINRPSVADIELYYRIGTDETNLTDVAWVASTVETSMPSDEDTTKFRDYEYLIGGRGGSIDPFTQFQLKMVFTSTNSSKIPTIQDLRVIALGV